MSTPVATSDHDTALRGEVRCCCSEHATAGMTDVINRTCSHDGCQTASRARKQQKRARDTRGMATKREQEEGEVQPRSRAQCDGIIRREGDKEGHCFDLNVRQKIWTGRVEQVSDAANKAVTRPLPAAGPTKRRSPTACNTRKTVRYGYRRQEVPRAKLHVTGRFRQRGTGTTECCIRHEKGEIARVARTCQRGVCQGVLFC